MLDLNRFVRNDSALLKALEAQKHLDFADNERRAAARWENAGMADRAKACKLAEEGHRQAAKKFLAEAERLCPDG